MALLGDFLVVLKVLDIGSIDDHFPVAIDLRVGEWVQSGVRGEKSGLRSKALGMKVGQVGFTNNWPPGGVKKPSPCLKFINGCQRRP